MDSATWSAELDEETYTTSVDLLAGTAHTLTPAGRLHEATFVAADFLPCTISAPGMFNVTYTFDIDTDPNAKGLSKIASGTRSVEFDYYTNGRLESITDAASISIFYHYDAVGRVERIVRPDSEDILFDYDESGNVEVLTTPKNVDHDFGYNRVDMNNSYTPPLSGVYGYEYDRDRRLEAMFPLDATHRVHLRGWGAGGD